MRTLEFSDAGIGRVIYRYADDPDRNGVVDAIGTVTVPADAHLTLLAEGVDSDDDLESVRDLPPDAIHAFEIGSRPINRAHLADPYGTPKFATIGITDRSLELLARQARLDSIKIDRLTQIDGSGLEAFVGHPSLRSLTLEGHPLNDSHAPLLAGMTSLRELRVSGSMLTDEGISQLAPLSLTVAALGGMELTDRALAVVSSWPELEVINMAGTGVTGSAFDHVAGLRSLRYSVFSSCPLEDKYFSLLHPLEGQELESVMVDHTQITDAATVGLAQLTGTRNLNVTHTQIGDDGIVRLVESMPSLRLLAMFGSNVSDSGRLRIDEIRPDLSTV